MKEHLFDKRVVQRALQEGLLEKEAYQRMLDELPDLSHKVQTAAESQAIEAARAAALAPADLEGESGDDSYEGDSDDDGPDEEPAQSAGVSDTIEMERPRIPGSYTPDY